MEMSASMESLGSIDFNKSNISPSASAPSTPLIIDEDSNTSTASSFGKKLRSRFIDISNEFKSKYNTVKLEELNAIIYRHNVSDQVATAIATAVLIDFGLITVEDRNLVIDRNKIRRQREKFRKEKTASVSFEGIEAFYFDGRKDNCIQFRNDAVRKVQEEHVSFVQQPNSFFMGHRTIESKESLHIADTIDDFLYQ